MLTRMECDDYKDNLEMLLGRLGQGVSKAEGGKIMAEFRLIEVSYCLFWCSVYALIEIVDGTRQGAAEYDACSTE